MTQGDLEEDEHLSRSVSTTSQEAAARRPLEHGCDAWWHWSQLHRSPEVLLYARTALFHPNWSHGTAAVRGTQELNGNLHYWEVSGHLGTKLFCMCTLSEPYES